MPATRDEFRALVEAQDVTTESGRNAYAALIGLSGAMDQVLPKIGDLSAAVATMVGRTTDVVGVMITDSEAAARSAGQAATEWERAVGTLTKFLASLTNSTDSALSLAQRNAINSLALERIYRDARGGNVDAIGDYSGAANSFLDTARASASTAAQYRVIEGRIRAQANTLAEVAKVGQSREELLEGLFNQQIGVLKELQDYLASDGITKAGLAGFGDKLGTLDTSIRNARLFDYDFVRENIRLDVMATTDLTPALERFLGDMPASVGDGLAGALDAPVDALTGALAGLGDAIRADMAARDRRTRASALGVYAESLVANDEGQQFAYDAAIRKMAEIAGISAQGRSLDDLRYLLEQFSDTDKIERILRDPTGARQDAFLNGPEIRSLNAQMEAARRAIEATNALSVASTDTVWNGDAGGMAGGRDVVKSKTLSDGTILGGIGADVRHMDVERYKADAIAAQQSAIDSLSRRIDDLGGLSSVSMTAPTAAAPSGGNTIVMRDPELQSEMKAVRRELEETRKENRQLMMQVAQNTRGSDKTLRKMDVIGMPAERTA